MISLPIISSLLEWMAFRAPMLLAFTTFAWPKLNKLLFTLTDSTYFLDPTQYFMSLYGLIAALPISFFVHPLAALVFARNGVVCSGICG